jgi:4,5-dihydroxyphthalate decarboxylase
VSAREHIPLAIGCCEPSSHRATAVLDGTLAIPGCTSRFVKLGPGEMLFRAFEDPELNVAELSFSNYVTRTVRGDCPYVMLPVYIARTFPHAAYYSRTDRGISSLADLRGKRVGIGEYQHTIYVWARGLLADEYGVDPRDVQWVSVVKDAHAAAHALQPPGVPVEILRTEATLSQMLEAGELDAVISARPPECFVRGAPVVRRIVVNDERAAADYLRRTGVFPILHVMGVRRELIAMQPQLARNVFTAFSKAKDLAFDAAASDTPNAWQNPAYSYGLGERDRKVLELFLSYHFEQGLSERRLDVADLFAPVSMDQYSA